MGVVSSINGSLNIVGSVTVSWMKEDTVFLALYSLDHLSTSGQTLEFLLPSLSPTFRKPLK